MYSAFKKIFLAAAEFSILVIVSVIIIACVVTCAISGLEILHAARLLPHFVEHVYVHLGGI